MEHMIAGQMAWTAALLDVWSGEGRMATEDMCHEAAGLLRALRAAGFVDCGDTASARLDRGDRSA